MSDKDVEVKKLLNLLADARTESMNLRARVTELEGQHKGMVLNNAILRERPDLPLNRIPAARAMTKLYEDNERLRAALELYRDAVRIDATMEGPKFMGANFSALKRAWDADRAALEEGMTSPDEREDCTGLEDSSTANPCGREDCEEEGRT